MLLNIPVKVSRAIAIAIAISNPTIGVKNNTNPAKI